jgi:hypothetical protein
MARIATAPIGPRVKIAQDVIITEDARGELIYEDIDMKLHCYECNADRLVIGTFISQPRFDPTEAYRLICGHSTI